MFVLLVKLISVTVFFHRDSKLVCGKTHDSDRHLPSQLLRVITPSTYI